MSTQASSTTMTLTEQWSKLAAILTNSVEQAETAEKLQKAATQQLDLAQYALSNLVDELATVMAVDGRRDRMATLYTLGTGSDTGAGQSRRQTGRRALAA